MSSDSYTLYWVKCGANPSCYITAVHHTKLQKERGVLGKDPFVLKNKEVCYMITADISLL